MVKPLIKVECPRCLGGKGTIKAFSHVRGGECFKCQGKGYVMATKAPAAKIWFRCWTVIDGEGGFYWSRQATSEKDAMKKTKAFIDKAISNGVNYDPENYRVERDLTRSPL